MTERAIGAESSHDAAGIAFVDKQNSSPPWQPRDDLRIQHLENTLPARGLIDTDGTIDNSIDASACSSRLESNECAEVSLLAGVGSGVSAADFCRHENIFRIAKNRASTRSIQACRFGTLVLTRFERQARSGR
jgi:hypothetical protein